MRGSIMSATSSRARQRLIDALPPGSIPVGVGLLVTGVTAYAYLILTARVLGPSKYVPLSVLWASVFIAGPGLFMPLQQEVGRLVAHHRLEGIGSGPIIKRAAALGAALAGIVLIALVVVVLADNRILFDGQSLLVAGFALAIVGYCLLGLLWGGLAGTGRFRHFAYAQSGDACLRIVICLCLALVGVKTVGPYGLVLGITPIIAALAISSRNLDLLSPGEPAPWSDLSRALGWLLVGSLGAQMLVNGSIIAVNILATPSDRASAGHLLAGLVIARVPLFLFGAVQAALLPRLASQARAGLWAEFRSGWVRLFVLVGAIALLATAGCFLFGPFVLRTFFGARFALGRSDLTLLAAASGAFMLTLCVAQALIALGHHARSAVGWLVGIAVFVVVTSLGHSLLPRVEVAYLAGALSALLVASGLLWRRLSEIERTLDPELLSVSSAALELEP
jgi:O-antigen/teichoic acid export membrane protein